MHIHRPASRLTAQMTAQITVRTDSRLEMKLFPVPQSAGLARRFVAHHLVA
jgi:hypothetical protein